MPNITNITPPRVPLLDPRSGLIAREWYLFFLSLFNQTGGSVVSLEDVQKGPPTQDLDVSALLAQGQKLVGVCFGHQLIAHCLGARVERAAQGWGLGRTVYDWHGPDGIANPLGKLALLASHQDQVLELPEGATLLASNAHCPIAAYSISEQVLFVQPHPEFDARYAAFLLGKRRAMFGEAVYQDRLKTLEEGHDGIQFGAFMLQFIYPDLGRSAPAAITTD